MGALNDRLSLDDFRYCLRDGLRLVAALGELFQPGTCRGPDLRLEMDDDMALPVESVIGNQVPGIGRKRGKAPLSQ